MDQLWKSVLDEIEVEVSKPIFHTFFSGTKLVLLENAVATIASLTQINASYIERRYYSLIKRILDKKTNDNVSLVFVARNKREEKKASSGPLFASDIIAHKKMRPSRIRADYTFENLAVSESNQLAYTAAQTVAATPGSKYNPLYLYGTVGVGKTHLMHAVANKVFDERDMNVVYLTTEEFTNEVVEAIRDKTTPGLRRKFRNVELLLLDDIQFLSGKEKVQEELFHTFNTLIDRGSQIIFTSDRPPHEIKKIEARLASRFEGGLTIDIEPPDFELRTAILLIKSKKFGIDLPLEAAKIAAERITDARALEGFLLKLSSVLTFKKETEISTSLITSLLGKAKDQPTRLRPDSVIETICEFFNVRATQLKGNKRDSYLVKPRHICMYLLKNEAGLTHMEIGNLLGGRDHTTVMHAVEKIELLASQNEQMNTDLLLIKQKIREEQA